MADRIINIEELPPGPTISIEVQDTHCHVTNGLITHNTRKFQKNEIASWFRVPPHMVGDLERATFSNIEHQGLEFVTHTMMPWLTRIEQGILKDLILAPQTYFAEFLVAGLLRGDLKSRYEAYRVGRNWGWLSTNDVRRLENMNPIRGGDDDYLRPLNMVRADATPEDIASARGKQLPAPPNDDRQARFLANEVAGQLVRKEIAALRKLAVRHASDDGSAWAEAVGAFYADFRGEVARRLDLGPGSVEEYVAGHESDLKRHAAVEGDAAMAENQWTRELVGLMGFSELVEQEVAT